jgi:hypothetical protein
MTTLAGVLCERLRLADRTVLGEQTMATLGALVVLAIFEQPRLFADDHSSGEDDFAVAAGSLTREANVDRLPFHGADS